MSRDLKRPIFSRMSAGLLFCLLQRHREHFDAGPKMSNNTVMSGDSKSWQEPLHVCLSASAPLQKRIAEMNMSFFRSLATQTGTSGILDCIKPRRGSSAFIALSLQYSPRISKQLVEDCMWRAWNQTRLIHMARSSSFVLLHARTLASSLYVSRRRLSLP